MRRTRSHWLRYAGMIVVIACLSSIAVSFASTVSLVLATNFPVGTLPSVAIGDFNADGKPDLATGNAGSNDVSILLGTGAGAFGPATNFPVGTMPNFVAVGDFNADKKPDLAVANLGSNNVSILLGSGNGTFARVPNFPARTKSGSVALGERSADGKPILSLLRFPIDNAKSFVHGGQS